MLDLRVDVVFGVIDGGTTVHVSSDSTDNPDFTEEPCEHSEGEGQNVPSHAISFEPGRGHTSRISAGTYTVANPLRADGVDARESSLFASSKSNSIHERRQALSCTNGVERLVVEWNFISPFAIN